MNTESGYVFPYFARRPYKFWFINKPIRWCKKNLGLSFFDDFNGRWHGFVDGNIFCVRFKYEDDARNFNKHNP